MTLATLAAAVEPVRDAASTAPSPNTAPAVIRDSIAVDLGLMGGHRCVSPPHSAPRSAPNGRTTVHHHLPGTLFPDAAALCHALAVSSGGVPGHQRWSHTCSGGEYEYITAPFVCLHFPGTLGCGILCTMYMQRVFFYLRRRIWLECCLTQTEADKSGSNYM